MTVHLLKTSVQSPSYLYLARNLNALFIIDCWKKLIDRILSQIISWVQGKSTVSALLIAVDYWHQSLEAKMDVCAVFFDLKKAFDSVPHRPLLLKLSIDPYLVQWIASYLCERQQAVCVEGSSLSYLPVLSGVPQGSVLGPLLFLTYIDEVSEVNISDSSLMLYADDIVIYRTICSSGDYLHLQNDVNALTDCVSSSLLNLNPTKCK